MCDRKLFIKNMVCDRCRMMIENVLVELQLQAVVVHMGVIELEDNITNEQKTRLKEKIEPLGFELISGKQDRLIEAVKIQILEMINNGMKDEHKNTSEYLKNNLKYDYGYLSNVFSSSEGVSIEHYVINTKIEKVKELLIEDELSLTEISYQLGYSSLAHLSAQFKKVTGVTASQYRAEKDVSSRISLDKL